MRTFLNSIATGCMLTALATAQPLPRYNVTDLGPVGPTPGQAYFITDNGLVSGAATSPDGTMHAVLWYRGSKIDIATRGPAGANSAAFGVNEKGHAAGEAETSDPNGDDFCGFNALGFPPSGGACVPFVWQNGVMTKLPTLGGANGVANLINNRDEVVGLAENNTHEPGCPVAQFKPVFWENGRIQELPAFPGDSYGGAFGINDNGEAVGSSGPCAPFNPGSQVYFVPVHALLWQNGTATDLGSFGGTGGFAGNHACAINNRTQVVGHSDLKDNTTTRAFLWTRETGMQNLGAVDGDFASLALGINDAGEVVGTSLDVNFSARAFLWEKGVMTDLNTLIPGNSSLDLLVAESVNSSGEITGLAIEKNSGGFHAYLATPGCRNRDNQGCKDDSGGADAQTTERPRVVLTANARELLLRRLGIRGRSAR